MLNELNIKNALNTNHIGKTIIFEDTTASTNLLAKENSHLPHGSIFVANEQTNGRGRLGRKWSSEKNSGIYISLLLEPKIKAEDIPKITLICGYAVCKIIENSKIKYPNDIVLNEKKICGILCELIEDTNNNIKVICGVGINVNNKSFDKELKNTATSLFLETGSTHSRVKIICDFLSEFEKLYEQFLKEGISSILKEYKKNCINIGKKVVATCKNTQIKGKCIDIDSAGSIVIESDGKIFRINSGEISIRGVLGYV